MGGGGGQVGDFFSGDLFCTTDQIFQASIKTAATIALLFNDMCLTLFKSDYNKYLLSLHLIFVSDLDDAKLLKDSVCLAGNFGRMWNKNYYRLYYNHTEILLLLKYV